MPSPGMFNETIVPLLSWVFGYKALLLECVTEKLENVKAA
ncbi:hypothetical protein KIS4809_3941 [Bacillus sp. ZZV12-4809]|nr:hypothetical protein KIS4809_3941 [Bacillus sp. ZZV12-4809]